MKIAVIGAGWAGMAAAVQAVQSGHRAIVFETSRTLGGRARAVAGTLPDGSAVMLDNGQHILIGAYSETLRLMRLVGVEPRSSLLRLPLALLYPDGQGLRLPAWPAPLDALAGIVTNRHWCMADKWSLLRLASSWHRRGFQCEATWSVAQLCRALPPRVMTELIEPLCVSALNTPADRASATVFLRVVQDALFSAAGGSNLLLPRTDLSTLFPAAAAEWLAQRGGQVRQGSRVDTISRQDTRWLVQGELFDAVVLATPAPETARILERSAHAVDNSVASRMHAWSRASRMLQFEAIATVYAWDAQAALSHPMLCLRNGIDGDHIAPAQFVFDRGQLGGPRGLLAFVVSASAGSREALETQVLLQARQQLGLSLQAVQTMVDKRATFACTPGLQRPARHIAPGLAACGDYVEGPYPATLEGAVRSAVVVIEMAASTARA